MHSDTTEQSIGNTEQSTGNTERPTGNTEQPTGGTAEVFYWNHYIYICTQDMLLKIYE